MTGWDVIDRASVLHRYAAAGLPTDAETCGSGDYLRLDPDWLKTRFLPWLSRNKPEPRGDAWRCVHFVHWMIGGLNEAGYLARVPHPHSCARAHCVTPERDAHAVGIILATDDQLYVLDPQDPRLIPLADYPVLSWSRVRLL